MKIGTSRVEAFSDGVIAIAITIMVLELKLPDIRKDASTQDILRHLSELAPYFGGLCIQLYDGWYFLDESPPHVSSARKDQRTVAGAESFFSLLDEPHSFCFGRNGG